MPAEYSGKPIFRHRYIGMDKDSIREEIDRLQSELFTMQDALDYYSKDNKEIRQNILDAQENNEKLLRGVEQKLQDLKDEMDYGTPVKTQLETVTKDFTAKLEEVYNTDRLKKLEQSNTILTGLNIVNTILILALIALVGHFIGL